MLSDTLAKLVFVVIVAIIGAYLNIYEIYPINIIGIKRRYGNGEKLCPHGKIIYNV